MPRIALIPGDGIGVEVVREARRVLEFVREAEGVNFELVEWDLGADRFLRDGITITEVVTCTRGVFYGVMEQIDTNVGFLVEIP